MKAVSGKRLIGLHDKSAAPHKSAEFRMGASAYGDMGFYDFTDDGEDAMRQREGEAQRAFLNLWKAARN